MSVDNAYGVSVVACGDARALATDLLVQCAQKSYLLVRKELGFQFRSTGVYIVSSCS